MPRTQVSCPNCRQPVVAEVKQLFDVSQDPRAKQEILSGMFNLLQCPHCGYQGNLATPIVYHDPEKELLLTYFPPEVQMTRDEQERVIGPLITRVMESLPQEQRKGYLLNPRTMLTLKGMVETILEADGITREMLAAQEKRLALARRLLSVSNESLPEVIRQESELIDQEFFALFARLFESALASGDQNAARRMQEVQSALLEHSPFGQELKSAAEALQQAQQDLQALGEGLTRESLLEMVISAPDDARLQAYVQLARPAMDYTFFQLLSQRIDQATGERKEHLLKVREKLLQYTGEVDDAIQQRREVARRNVETLLQAEDLPAAVRANLPAIDEFFVEALSAALEEARQKGDLERSSRLQQVLTEIEKLSAPPPEIQLVEELVEMADDEQSVLSRLQSLEDDALRRLTDMLTSMAASLEADSSEQAAELRERLQKVYNAALRLSMKRSMGG